MSTRTTIARIEKKLEAINRTLGRPLSPVGETEDGKIVWNIGNISYSDDGSGYGLNEITGSSGGVSQIAGGYSLNSLDDFVAGMLAAIRLDKK